LVNDLQIAKVVVSSFKGGVSREEEEEEEEAKFPFPPLLPKSSSTFKFSYNYLKQVV
jgi:hypothetical protein